LPNIYHYLDYRKFLKDAYKEKRAGDAGFTHRDIGRLGDFDPGLFSKVITGQRNISKKLVPGFCLAFELQGKVAKFFELLVLFNQARTHSDRKKYFEQILAAGGKRIIQVAKDQYEFYDKWYYTAVRELLSFYSFKGDYKDLAEQLFPKIKPKEARKAVELLENLGFIKKMKNGKYEIVDRQITTGYDSKAVAVDNFILQCMDLAKGSVDRFKGRQRNLSTVTFSISHKDYPVIEEKIRAFRRELMEFIRNGEGQDMVCNLNMHLFPLTQTRRRGK
jgi:uncharacterized protein (TIGR02147 family)